MRFQKWGDMGRCVCSALAFVGALLLPCVGNTATLYHCKNHSGGTFWASAHCAKHNSLIDRTVTVPDNMPFEQQVQIGNKVRADAEALYAPPAQAQQPTSPQPEVNCTAIAQEIASLDAMARQLQSAGTQDAIAQRRKALRDTQFRNRCR